MANFVKIQAQSPNFLIKLFIPERETGKVLKAIQEKHSQYPADMQDEYKDVPGLSSWVNKNFLSVTMRRVRITDQKARRLKDRLQPLALIPTL